MSLFVESPGIQSENGKLEFEELAASSPNTAHTSDSEMARGNEAVRKYRIGSANLVVRSSIIDQTRQQLVLPQAPKEKQKTQGEMPQYSDKPRNHAGESRRTYCLRCIGDCALIQYQDLSSRRVNFGRVMQYAVVVKSLDVRGSRSERKGISSIYHGLYAYTTTSRTRMIMFAFVYGPSQCRDSVRPSTTTPTQCLEDTHGPKRPPADIGTPSVYF